MESVKRSAARYRVFLSVRYETASDFVREYAENLSHGGLFIRGARGLGRRRDVVVDLDLPGYGVYQLRAEVVHVIGDDQAREHGRTPGAGLAIREAPAGFEEALSGYLIRLGHRSDSMVLARTDEAARLLRGAGYQVERAPDPGELGGALDACEAPVVGVVVPEAELDGFRDAAGDGRACDLLLTMDGSGQLDRVLVELDRRL